MSQLDNIPLTAIAPAIGGLLGTVAADNTGLGAKDKIRGGLIGASTGLGAALGRNAIGDSLGEQAAGAGGGALLAFLASKGLLSGMVGESRPAPSPKPNLRRRALALERLAHRVAPFNNPYYATSMPSWNPSTYFWPAGFSEYWLRGQEPSSLIQSPSRSLFSHVKTGDYAKGISDKSKYGDPSKLPLNKLLDFVTQQHDAIRAGRHFDYRIGTPEHGLFSWASKHPMPEPGQKRTWFMQPLHDYAYKDFEGEIPSGYGAGKVKTHEAGSAIINRIDDQGIHFSVASRKHPERFVLVRPKGDGKNWLLVNTTPNKPLDIEKIKYKSIPEDKVEDALKMLEPGSTVSAKIDGASALNRLARQHNEIFSYRTSKLNDRPIVHTERFYDETPNRLDIPKDLENTALRGEIYGLDNKGQVLPPQTLGGILNATPENSIRTQQDRGYKLKQLVYDIAQLGNDKSIAQKPYPERLGKVRDVLSRLKLPEDKFHLPDEQATTPDAALKLWRQIGEGRHPLTSEGVVIQPSEGKPIKAKYGDEHDVYVRNVFPGLGKYKDIAAGGFEYSHTPDGDIVGKVGTGISDDLRKDLWQNKDSYIGRVARIRAQQKLPSGAFRVPSLLAFHEDYPTQIKSAFGPAADPGTAAASFGLSIAGLLASLAASGYASRQFDKALKDTPQGNANTLQKVYKTLNIPNDLPAIRAPGFDNAAYYHSGHGALRNLQLDLPEHPYFQDQIDKKRDAIKRLGAIVYDPDFMRAGVLAHEAGHADIDINKPWYSPSRINQRLLVPAAGLLNRLAPIAGSMAGFATANPLIGAGVGLGAGAITALPQLINEYQATSRAKRYLDASSHRPETIEKNKRALRKAFGTYAVAGTAPSAIIGAVGGLRGLLKSGEQQSAVQQLLQAKAYSDVRKYKLKHAILISMLKNRPEEFRIDSHSNGIVGLTHKSGFRIHMPVQNIPADMWQRYTQPTSEELTPEQVASPLTKPVELAEEKSIPTLPQHGMHPRL